MQSSVIRSLWPGFHHGVRLSSSAQWFAIICTSVLATLLAAAVGRAAAPTCATSAASAPPIVPAAAPLSALDALHGDAALGHPLAAVTLVGMLLDRYETSGEALALFEAALVLDRQWDTPEMLASDQIRRVVERRCPAEPLLRHFWLCEAGE